MPEENVESAAAQTTTESKSKGMSTTKKGVIAGTVVAAVIGVGSFSIYQYTSSKPSETPSSTPEDNKSNILKRVTQIQKSVTYKFSN